MKFWLVSVNDPLKMPNSFSFMKIKNNVKSNCSKFCEPIQYPSLNIRVM